MPYNENGDWQWWTMSYAIKRDDGKWTGFSTPELRAEFAEMVKHKESYSDKHGHGGGTQRDFTMAEWNDLALKNGPIYCQFYEFCPKA